MYKLMKILFIITGTKFYMDWILPTNPRTKNPVFKIFSLIQYFDKDKTINENLKTRLISSYTLGTVHIIGFIIWEVLDYSVFVNIIGNVYPILVQIFIGYRCYYLLNKRKNYELQSI